MVGQQHRHHLEAPPKELLLAVTNAISSKNRAREFLDILRQFCQYVMERNVKIERDFAETLCAVLLETNTSPKLRTTIVFILLKATLPDLSIFEKSLKGVETKTQSFIQTLALCMGGNRANRQLSFKVALASYLSMLYYPQESNLRCCTIPGLLQAVRYHPHLVGYTTHIKPVETQLADFLAKASTVSDHKSAPNIFFKLGSAAAPVTEIDGSPTREFFTILNNSLNYTEDQIFNICSFSMLYAWLDSVHMKAKQRNAMGPSSGEGVGQLGLTPHLQEVILSYCLRVIDQSKLKAPNDSSPSPLSNDLLQSTALSEAVRILTKLCDIEPRLVPRFFTPMKKLFTSHLPASTPLAQVQDPHPQMHNQGPVLLTLLQFFVTHSDVVVYDPEPVFRAYFYSYLSSEIPHPLVAYETIMFCINNKEHLLNSTNVFTAYFPPLLKLVAWYPRSVDREFCELLPGLISPSTFIELFHSLLDLPLVTAAMETALNDSEKSDADLASPEYFRVLYNYLLRNESGVSINFWENEATLPMLQQFCTKKLITPRIAAVAQQVPIFLGIYFDVMIGYAEENQMKDILPIVFQRMNQLYPYIPFQDEVRNVMVTKIVAIFQKWPSFIATMKQTITSTMSTSMLSPQVSLAELSLALCWVVGEAPTTNPLFTNEIIADYHETLEIFAYERMTTVKLAKSGLSEAFIPPTILPLSPLLPHMKPPVHTPIHCYKPLDVGTFTTRLMSIVMSCLAKLASRCQDLTSRVVLCLLKVVEYQQYFDPVVIARANELITLLKFPSIAAAILDMPHTQIDSAAETDMFHIHDKNSSLPFLLLPLSDSSQTPQDLLHPFNLY